jgi:glycosyltransferase involved in cell wall biosynthesis
MDNIYIEQLHNLFMLLSIPLVSCCISTWNRVDDLRKCVESIQSQSYPNIEIVIVDNCSTDGTFEYCMELGCTYHRMENSKSTAMETLNLAFSMASGEYILVLDDDAELVNNNSLMLAVNYMEDNLQTFSIAYNIPWNTEYGQLNDRNCVPEFCGAVALMRRSIGEILNWYDKTLYIYGNELDLCIRAYIRGYTTVYLHDCIASHVKSMNSRSNYIRHKYTLKNSLNAVIKYFGWKNRIKMTFIYGAGHVYYILHTDCKLKLFMWWILWYIKSLFQMICINNVQAPQWIQDYYYERLLHMVGLR